MNKTALIIGNGKSSLELEEFGFERIPKSIDTFGTTLAFRYYEKIGWWPTYYGILDTKVVNHHKENLKEFFTNYKEVI
jgi:hypothetical protein